MKKKILIGSLLVLTLLLLMPSIPAIQQKTIEEGIKQDLQEKLDTINIKWLDDIKHPILYKFVMLYLGFLWFRIGILNELWNIIDLIESRYIRMLVRYMIIINFWVKINEEFGWNWDIKPFPC